MSSRFSPDEFARRYIQEARRRVLSSIPDDLSDDLRKALSATSWLLEIVKNVQMAHTRNKALDAIRQHEICVQSEELFREGISDAKDSVAPVLKYIRLAAADKEIVSFGKHSETTAFDVVLREADRTLMLVDLAKMMKTELADTLSSYFPSPPPFKEWKSLRAKLEKEVLRAGILRPNEVRSGKSGSKIQTETEKHPDGPEPPNLLWVNGEKHEIAPMLWQLINHMWDKNKEKEIEVTQAVWSDQIADGTLRTTISRANNEMAKALINRKLFTKAGYVCWKERP